MNNNRVTRFLGTFVAVSAFAGCAVQPSQTNNAAANDLRTSAGAPVAFSGAAASLPSTNAGTLPLAAAKPIDANIPDVSRFKQTGRASWYGRRFDGRRTASGERYDMNAMTAAHKTLPLAAYVRVTNTTNQKSIVVRINDRGPYVRGRVIDLSFAAARELGLQQSGTARVKIQGLTQQEALAARQETVASVSEPKDPQ